jgi:hypothetical protein
MQAHTDHIKGGVFCLSGMTPDFFKFVENFARQIP